MRICNEPAHLPNLCPGEKGCPLLMSPDVADGNLLLDASGVHFNTMLNSGASSPVPIQAVYQNPAIFISSSAAFHFLELL